MIFSEKLHLLRKNRGMTQDELAERIQVSRQAVAKWESGMTYPDIMNLIQISTLFHVTVDYLVKDNVCGKVILAKDEKGDELTKLIQFRLEASQNTYAGFGNTCESSRVKSHDYSYVSGDYMYYDTYLGGECFTGEEAIWKLGTPSYSMNYMGRVLDERFSGDFLKEALRAATKEMPYRGPAVYQSGNYLYQSKVSGSITWFQGYEEIFYENNKVYECYFHGGKLR